MAIKKQKLELTWIGKGEDPVLEPRILIEDPTKSYGDQKSENMLIHGDNLLALKALEQDFSGRIKCIYIDPPYNTGSAFEHYDDGLEHSIWINLMKSRLEILKRLLSRDGVIFISIDDEEYAYLKVLCDEVFDRRNFCGNLVWEKKKKPSFLSNMGIVTEYVLVYSKDRSYSPAFVYGETTKNKKYPINNAGNGVRILNFKAGSVFFRIPDGVINPKDMSSGNIITRLLDKVEIKDGINVNDFRLEGEWRYSQLKLDEIISNKETILISQDPFRPNHIKLGGEPKKMKNLLSVAHYSMDTYENSSVESIKLFGNNPFDYPKPEKLIYTIISSITSDDDFVLDSFLGSGTTAAVAQKMGRKWIGVELGDHVYTHCLSRLRKVVDGNDGLPLSKTLNWKGGGGFKFYELAPSLLNKDEHGNWIISKEYNADMLAAAVAKNNGFKYSPDQNFYWKQGQSSEKDFIFTTTNFVTVEFLDKIHDEIQPGESLLICCKAFQESCENRFSNITIKKIPLMLLGKCEFGKEDYSLNIINVPTEDNKDIKENDENKLNNEKKETEVSQLNLLDK
jgi:adenine-specific DNA-methyltransferase